MREFLQPYDKRVSCPDKIHCEETPLAIEFPATLGFPRYLSPDG